MDLERLFRQIVLNLAARDSAELSHPLTLAEIRDSIVPYRANRRALQIQSSEDYELALLRLCAGEAGLARTEPRDVQTKFAAEAEGSNPDLGLLHQHDQATIHLDPAAVNKVLDPKPDLRFAPSHSIIAAVEKAPPKRASRKAESRSVETPLVACTRCAGTLPVGRVVKFCPQCGQNLVRLQCPQCNTEVESSWRHCVECGGPLAQFA